MIETIEASSERGPCAFWRGKTALVAGGSGFLGFQIVRRLLSAGARVRSLSLQPPEGHPLLSLEGVERRFADLRDGPAVREALHGVEVVFNAAGSVQVSRTARRDLRQVHVEGTRRILEALEPGARLVHTSSVVAVGGSSGEPLDEESPWNLARLRVDYVQAKREAEELALAAAASGREVVVVNPGFLAGPEDHGPSVMGRFFLRFWKGRVPLAPRGGINVVDVRDVARGHLLAAERGRPGRRTILGGENVSYADLLRLLAAVAGMRPRVMASLPRWLLWPLAGAAEARAALLGREPYPSFQHARLQRFHWFYDSSRARGELGFAPRPLLDTLRETFEWHRPRHRLQLSGVKQLWMRQRCPARS